MDFDNSFCRLCAESKPRNKQVDLQTESETRGEIIEKLTRINATTEFIDNKLPTTVCFECISSLNQSFDFVIRIETAQTYLNEVFYLRSSVKKEVCSDDEDSFGSAEADAAGIDVGHVKTESDNTAKKPGKNPSKVKKSASLDSMPLSQLKKTWSDYSWLCTFCETMFPTIDELQTHSIAVHNICNPYRCTDCKIRKERLDKFIIHVRRHNKHLKFSCYKCCKKFERLSSIRKHELAHLKTEFKCPGCNATFSSKDEQKEHQDKYFKVKYARDLAQPPLKDYTCQKCNKTYASRNGLNQHLLVHEERKREHTCEVCGKCFFQKHNLAGHIILHSGDRPYKCQICKSGFKTKAQLKSHITIHNNEKPFSCDQCGRRFKMLKQLKNHSIIHTDLLPYPCPHCDKRFRFKTILNNHVRLHTGEKPYSCEACQRDFSNWSNFNKHMKRKHNHDQAKKKHTPEGVYPIDPNTGEVIIHAVTKQTMEWKHQMLQRRKRGRPFKTDDHEIVKTENNGENSS